MKQEYTARTARLLGQEKVDLLGTKTVLLFGLGGVGSYVAEALARAGVGHLILVDADTFEASNINRQLSATVQTLGKYKCDVEKERLLSINPDLVIDTHCVFYLPNTMKGFIRESGAQYVVDAIDTMSAKIDIVTEAYEAGIPVISSMGAGNKLHPERFEIAAIEKTSVDPLAKIMRKELRRRGVRHIKVVYSKEQPLPVQAPAEEGKRPSPGSISFVPPVAGFILAGQVIRDLLEIE